MKHFSNIRNLSNKYRAKEKLNNTFKLNKLRLVNTLIINEITSVVWLCFKRLNSFKF